MKQGREARACQETAEGLRKPESGTGAGVDGPPQHGASPRDTVGGAEDLRGVGPSEGSDGREVVKTLEGRDARLE